MTIFCDTVKLRNELSQCRKQNKLLIEGSAKCQEQLEIIGKGYSEVLDKLGDANRKIALLTEGPGPPDAGSLRVLTWAVLNQALTRAIGDFYTSCPHKHFSDGDWLVSPTADIDRYLVYFREHWLPLAKPYTVLEWTKLDGTKVQIWACNCDDFADLLHGLPTIHHNYWSGLPWGLFWGKIEGIFISGYHAFNFIVTYDNGFDENSANGLRVWFIEPQQGSRWTVGTPFGPIDIIEIDSYALREITPQSFHLTEPLRMTKV